MLFKQQKLVHTFIAALSSIFLSSTYADSNHVAINADGHAPIGVMGDHLHKKGEWMVSFRSMEMSMSGNLQGSDNISSDEIATTIPNTFFGMPMMPPTLRIVPQEMDVKMQMLGLMYAPSDTITLMLMANYIEKEMTLLTYQGGMGTNRLGRFKTKASGIGDTKISALIHGFKDSHQSLHFNLGFSLPTGSIDNDGTALTPMNMRSDVRLPYAMQLGSGTYDFEPGITYKWKHKQLSLGSQYKATLRIGENDENYTLGDIHQPEYLEPIRFRR